MKLTSQHLLILEKIVLAGYLKLQSPSQIKVKMAQAILESGYWNEQNSKSYYVRSNYTNMFGMGYNKRGYADSYFIGGTGEKWAIYPSQWKGILDRYAWDYVWKTNSPAQATGLDEYISACARHGYWVESGRDKGYTKLLYDTISKHETTFNTLLAIPFVGLASCYMYLK